MSNIIHFRTYFYERFPLIYHLIVKKLQKKKSVRSNHVKNRPRNAGNQFEFT
ncbi:hypothetical protein HanRHA438_Chr02g0067601 [Helianthus annuus]|nr:hypothetical protein HanRHA438_Chr02g0067601 [Helianthus annuus]